MGAASETVKQVHAPADRGDDSSSRSSSSRSSSVSDASSSGSEQSDVSSQSNSSQSSDSDSVGSKTSSSSTLVTSVTTATTTEKEPLSKASSQQVGFRRASAAPETIPGSNDLLNSSSTSEDVSDAETGDSSDSSVQSGESDSSSHPSLRSKDHDSKKESLFKDSNTTNNPTQGASNNNSVNNAIISKRSVSSLGNNKDTKLDHSEVQGLLTSSTRALNGHTLGGKGIVTRSDNINNSSSSTTSSDDRTTITGTATTSKRSDTNSSSSTTSFDDRTTTGTVTTRSSVNKTKRSLDGKRGGTFVNDSGSFSAEKSSDDSIRSYLEVYREKISREVKEGSIASSKPLSQNQTEHEKQTTTHTNSSREVPIIILPKEPHVDGANPDSSDHGTSQQSLSSPHRTKQKPKKKDMLRVPRSRRKREERQSQEKSKKYRNRSRDCMRGEEGRVGSREIHGAALHISEVKKNLSRDKPSPSEKDSSDLLPLSAAAARGATVRAEQRQTSREAVHVPQPCQVGMHESLPLEHSLTRDSDLCVVQTNSTPRAIRHIRTVSRDTDDVVVSYVPMDRVPRRGAVKRKEDDLFGRSSLESSWTSSSSSSTLALRNSRESLPFEPFYNPRRGSPQKGVAFPCLTRYALKLNEILGTSKQHGTSSPKQRDGQGSESLYQAFRYSSCGLSPLYESMYERIQSFCHRFASDLHVSSSGLSSSTSAVKYPGSPVEKVLHALWNKGKTDSADRNPHTGVDGTWHHALLTVRTLVRHLFPFLSLPSSTVTTTPQSPITSRVSSSSPRASSHYPNGVLDLSLTEFTEAMQHAYEHYISSILFEVFQQQLDQLQTGLILPCSFLHLMSDLGVLGHTPFPVHISGDNGTTWIRTTVSITIPTSPKLADCPYLIFGHEIHGKNFVPEVHCMGQTPHSREVRKNHHPIQPEHHTGSELPSVGDPTSFSVRIPERQMKLRFLPSARLASKLYKGPDACDYTNTLFLKIVSHKDPERQEAKSLSSQGRKGSIQARRVLVRFDLLEELRSFVDTLDIARLLYHCLVFSLRKDWRQATCIDYNVLTVAMTCVPSGAQSTAGSSLPQSPASSHTFDRCSIWASLQGAFSQSSSRGVLVERIWKDLCVQTLRRGMSSVLAQTTGLRRKNDASVPVTEAKMYSTHPLDLVSWFFQQSMRHYAAASSPPFHHVASTRLGEVCTMIVDLIAFEGSPCDTVKFGAVSACLRVAMVRESQESWTTSSTDLHPRLCTALVSRTPEETAAAIQRLGSSEKRDVDDEALTHPALTSLIVLLPLNEEMKRSNTPYVLHLQFLVHFLNGLLTVAQCEIPLSTTENNATELTTRSSHHAYRVHQIDSMRDIGQLHVLIVQPEASTPPSRDPMLRFGKVADSLGELLYVPAWMGPFVATADSLMALTFCWSLVDSRVRNTKGSSGDAMIRSGDVLLAAIRNLLQEEKEMRSVHDKFFDSMYSHYRIQKVPSNDSSGDMNKKKDKTLIEYLRFLRQLSLHHDTVEQTLKGFDLAMHLCKRVRRLICFFSMGPKTRSESQRTLYREFHDHYMSNLLQEYGNLRSQPYRSQLSFLS